MNPLRILLFASTFCLLPLGPAHAGDEPPPGPEQPAETPAQGVVVQALDARDLIGHLPGFLDHARAKAKALGLTRLESRDGLLVVSGSPDALGRLSRWLAEQRAQMQDAKHAIEKGREAIQRAQEALARAEEEARARAEAARAHAAAEEVAAVEEGAAGPDAEQAREALEKGELALENARKQLDRLRHALAEAKAGGRSLEEVGHLQARLAEVERRHAHLVEQQSGHHHRLADLARRWLVIRKDELPLITLDSGASWRVGSPGEWARLAVGAGVDPETQQLQQRRELLRKLHALLLQLGDAEQAERTQRQIHEVEQALKAREERRAAEQKAAQAKAAEVRQTWLARFQKPAPGTSDAAILEEVRALRREVKELKELLLKHLDR